MYLSVYNKITPDQQKFLDYNDILSLPTKSKLALVPNINNQELAKLTRCQLKGIATKLSTVA